MIHILFDLYRQRLSRLGVCCGLVLLIVLTACNDKDEQYERPSWLEPPIYDVLAEKGNFSLYLQAVDKTLYSSILKGAGNYTVFAPNDQAFRAYLEKKGYASVDVIPVDELTKIVAYSMVFNRFEASRLGDVLASSVWETGTSIKKRSSYYKTLYKEKINGVEQWVVDSPVDSKTGAPTDVTAVVTPYKYLPIFTESYFSTNILKPEDYEKFFSGTTYSGLHAGAGSVLTKNIYAENGIVHEVDAVNLPLENLDEMLKNDSHQAFREILETKVGDSYLFISYLLGENTTEVYKKLYPDRNISAVYCKAYIKDLPYRLNNEDYKGTETGTTEQQGYTLLVPSNEAVNNFKTKLLERANVSKLSDLSLTTLTYFLKAHMVPRMVWPSQFTTELNPNEEYLNGSGKDGATFDNCVSESRFASNGVLYRLKDIVKSKYFNTVYSEILLNEDCRSLANVAYEKSFVNDWIPELTKCKLTGDKETDYIMVLPSDNLLEKDGFTYDEVNKTFNNSNAKDVSAEDRMKRLLRTCVFKRTKEATELTDFSGSGFPAKYGGYGYAVNIYGDMIRFKNNKLQGLGNILDNTEVEVEEIDFNYINGRVFRIINEEMLQYSPRKTGSGIAAFTDPKLYDRICAFIDTNPQCGKFKQYMDIVYGENTSPSFIRASTYYTVLIPTDDAINNAVNEYGLPELPTDGESFTSEDRSLAERFLKLCFLTGSVVPDDGMPYIEPDKNESLTLNTVYKLTDSELDLWSVNTSVVVSKDDNNNLTFAFSDIKKNDWTQVEGYNPVNVVRGENQSNFMGPLSVIHTVDDIIWFKTNPQQK